MLSDSELTLFASTLMSFWEAMLQTHLGTTLLAGVCVDGAQLLSAALRGTLGPLVDLGIVSRIAVLSRMPLKHCIWVVSGCELDSFCTYWADNCTRFARAGLAAAVRLICTVLETEDLAATVTRERQEVYLLTLWDTAVRSQGEQISRASVVHMCLPLRCAHYKSRTEPPTDVGIRRSAKSLRSRLVFQRLR